MVLRGWKKVPGLVSLAPAMLLLTTMVLAFRDEKLTVKISQKNVFFKFFEM
jgi:hypothetical protein